MKKNGFLSVSTVFAFFLVFLGLMLYIILGMSNNRFLLDKMKTTIKNDLIEETEMEDKIDVNFTLADWVKSQYTGIQGDNNLYYHDSILENGAGDNSYRYAGAHDEVNNFVCFGTDAKTCPDDNLYRIIGVFGDQVKLIKWDYATSTLLGTDGAYKYQYSDGEWSSRSKGNNDITNVGSYYWTKNNDNLWSTSVLNTINLNENYLSSIGIQWSDMIVKTNWIVGGNTADNIKYDIVSNEYTNEIITPVEDIKYEAKIGLMYVSDYYYGALPTYWTTYGSKKDQWNDVDYSSARDYNWMYMGLWEWPITRNSEENDYVFAISFLGGVDTGSVTEAYFPVRPVFYLNSNVMRISGSGSKTDSIRLG